MSPEVMSILNSAVGMACGAALMGLFTLGYNRFKKTTGLPGRIGRIEDAAMLTIRTSDKTIIAISAIIDILVDNKMNGNVTDARKAISDAKEESSMFFAKMASGVREREVILK